MTDEEIGFSLPGPSYAHALADGIGLRLKSPRFTDVEKTCARREANNLARLIEQACLPGDGKGRTGEALAYTKIIGRLKRFGREEELHHDFPEAVDSTPLLLANFDELARRVETALAPLARRSKKGGAR